MMVIRVGSICSSVPNSDENIQLCLAIVFLKVNQSINPSIMPSGSPRWNFRTNAVSGDRRGEGS